MKHHRDAPWFGVFWIPTDGLLDDDPYWLFASRPLGPACGDATLRCAELALLVVACVPIVIVQSERSGVRGIAMQLDFVEAMVVSDALHHWLEGEDAATKHQEW